MGSNLFADSVFSTKCQGCGEIMEIKVVDLEKSPEIKCPKCGSVKKIESNELKAAREGVNREVDKFKDALGRVGK
jgi:DNA-directed RNA polymerase subunit M/transcription elongation factor TFIIS